MQHLLTEQEYQALNEKPSHAELLEYKLALSIMSSVLMKASKQKCIHDDDARDSGHWYCDNCPLSSIALGHEASKLACDKPKEYSK